MGIAIITGASSGIGAEFARQLEKRADVSHLWLIARRKEQMTLLSQDLQKPTTIITADLSTREGCFAIGELLHDEKPDVTYLVNSAGFGKNGDFCEIDREAQLSMIDLNCRAIIDITHNTLPYMKRESAVINISSIAGNCQVNFSNSMLDLLQ